MRKGRKYKLILEDESRLKIIWSLRLTPRRTIGLSVATISLAIGLAICIIVFTPFKTLLPGYMKKSQRAGSIEAIMKLDSLENAYELNTAYLNNIALIFNTERTPEITTTPNDSNSVITDTIKGQSKEELEFKKMMAEREKYNVSILAPLAAEGMLFTSPAVGSITSEDSQNSTKAKILIPNADGINSITDGTVVDIHYQIGQNNYTIIIQHPKGFMSKYSFVGKPIVGIGQDVRAGQRISLTTQSNGEKRKFIMLEMWRNGTPLIPAEYITEKYSTEISPKIDEEVGRGK